MTDSVKDGEGTRRLLPCPECGAEVFHGENTGKAEYTPTDADGNPEFTFGGQPAVRETTTKECPECGAEVLL